MKADNDNLLTLGIFAHANAGKTTLTENLLYRAGIVQKIGKVDTGNTVTDGMNVERERGISVRASLVEFSLGNKRVQLIDTPGHIDFAAEVERSMSVLDAAIFVVSGADGIEAQTISLWKILKNRNIPVFFFINKLDRVGGNYDKVIQELKTELHIPLIRLTDAHYDSDGKPVITARSKERILEELADFDNDSLDKYLKVIDKKDTLSAEYIDEKIAELTEKRIAFPVSGGSALDSIGIDYVVRGIEKYLPTYQKNDQESFSAFIYSKRIENTAQYYTKILSGQISVRDMLETPLGDQQKVTRILRPEGSKLVPVETASSGDIVVLNGLDVVSGTLIGENPLFKPVKFVQPIFDMNVDSKKTDKIKLLSALKVLVAEDPYLNVRFDHQTQQIMVSLMGDVQSEIITTLLKERFDMDVNISKPVVICKEKPTQTGLGKASYTCVSGIEFKIDPLPAGSGLVFESLIPTGTLLKKYQNQARRQTFEYFKQGIHGWEVIDAKVSLLDGKFDSMGSKPKHFNIIIPLALYRALRNSKVQIMEPVSTYTIEAHKNMLKPLSNLLSLYHSRPMVREMEHDGIALIGSIRSSKLIELPIQIRKITSGRGHLSSEFLQYTPSLTQSEESKFFGPDPRNEVPFVITEMGASLDDLDVPLAKKQMNGAKFKWKKELREGRK